MTKREKIGEIVHVLIPVLILIMCEVFDIKVLTSDTIANNRMCDCPLITYKPNNSMSIGCSALRLNVNTADSVP